jgi:hypothetical protein
MQNTASPIASLATPGHLPTLAPVVPAWIKWGYTAFMALLVPIYWVNYGPTNFLYFCDAALFLTLFAVWAPSRLAASMAAVGILIPQFFWCVDFACELCGFPFTSMTRYMFNAESPLHLRGLSLFHGWLPFLLLFLVWRLGYDRRALVAWTSLAWALCLVAFFLLPPAGAQLPNPNLPRNVNYVFGMNDAQPQQWLLPEVYLAVWMVALTALIYVPTHCLLRWLDRRQNAPRPAAQP